MFKKQQKKPKEPDPPAKPKVDPQVEAQRREKAATKIQAVVRGRMARKLVAHRRERRQRELAKQLAQKQAAQAAQRRKLWYRGALVMLFVVRGRRLRKLAAARRQAAERAAAAQRAKAKPKPQPTAPAAPAASPCAAPVPRGISAKEMEYTTALDLLGAYKSLTASANAAAAKSVPPPAPGRPAAVPASGAAAAAKAAALAAAPTGLDRQKAKAWLRSAGWLLPEADLDAMLDNSRLEPGEEAVVKKPAKAKPAPPFNFDELAKISEAKGRENQSLEGLQAALRRLARDKPRMEKSRFVELVTQAPDFHASDVSELLQMVGMGAADPIGCDSLARALLERACRPFSSMEYHKLKVGQLA